MSAHYRIVEDEFAGYEVQIWRWWWPFWVEANWVNTHSSVERAERWAARHARKTVKYLGRFEA